MRGNWWIIAAGAIMVPVTPVLYLIESRAAARCLGAGGSYDYAAGTCDQDRAHPVLPWARRNRGWVMMSSAGVGLILIGVATSRIPRRENP